MKCTCLDQGLPRLTVLLTSLMPRLVHSTNHI